MYTFCLRLLYFWKKQGIPFRGHVEKTISSNKGNFIELQSTKDDLHALRNDEMYLKISEKSRLFASKNGLNNQEYQLKHKRFQKNLVPT